MTTLKNLGLWLKRHFDFALILAAAVEIPRWTVTFLAIHEPLWVGIPLGALLAYATSEGWKAYFLDTRRYKLLAFNIASLAAATFVITPVLFSMASAPIDEIDLAALLPSAWLLAWSGVLAVTTFAPLIQLAAVKSAPTAKPQEIASEAAKTKNRARENVSAPVALPTVTLPPQNAIEATDEPAAESPNQPQAAAGRRLTDAEKQTIINMSSNGMKGAAIAKALDLNENTVRSTIARASKPAVHHNGIAKEPSL